ncbi:MAG: carboxypeptidase regulatory-like domain-containing protein, partial [Gemmatimonadetes bacterium]|nr:carboxypeptidase regulatory-like domain-containing protein [Gemmatimonadota bacterium]
MSDKEWRFPLRLPPRSVATTVVAVALMATCALVPSGVAGQSPLDEIAGLTVDGELIETALRLLQRSAGVSLVYSPDFLPDDRRVSCACADVRVRRALDIILSGTGLTYTASRTQIRIVPARRAPSGVTPGAIAGRVVDSEGDPVVNAMVRIEESPGGLSDTRGRFLVRNVLPGTHQLQVTSIGWEAGAVQGVEVQSADTTTLTVRLQRAVISLPEIRVAPGTFGFLEEVMPGTVRTLTRDE